MRLMSPSEPTRGPAEVTRPMLAWFLCVLSRLEADGLDKTVLDCGAGGRTPPLAHFAERGYECHGIDISEEQVRRAVEYAEEHGYALNLRVGDMRELSYSDESFSYVYELESMCHLTKADTKRALSEMRRVLRPGGYLFAHFMSTDFWPITGREEAPGEFAETECGKAVVHSYFEDDEVSALLQDMRIVWKQKRFTYVPYRIDDLTLEEWRNWFVPDSTRYARSEWDAMYEDRSRYCYAAWEVIARKAPSDL